MIVAAFGVTNGFVTRCALPQFTIAGSSVVALTARNTAAWCVVPLGFWLLHFVALGQPFLLLQLARPVLGEVGKNGITLFVVDRDAGHLGGLHVALPNCIRMEQFYRLPAIGV